MIRNVGNLDRFARATTAAALAACSFLAPFPLETRMLAFAVPAVYLLFTALKGSCLGYRMMGSSTCPASASRQ